MFHIKPGGSIILIGHLGERPPPGHTSINFLMLFNFLAIFVRNVTNCGRNYCWFVKVPKQIKNITPGSWPENSDLFPCKVILKTQHCVSKSFSDSLILIKNMLDTWNNNWWFQICFHYTVSCFFSWVIPCVVNPSLSILYKKVFRGKEQYCFHRILWQ